MSPFMLATSVSDMTDRLQEAIKHVDELKDDDPKFQLTPQDLRPKIDMYCTADVQAQLVAGMQHYAAVLAFAMRKSFALTIGWKPEKAASLRDRGLAVPSSYPDDTVFWQVSLQLAQV